MTNPSLLDNHYNEHPAIEAIHQLRVHTPRKVVFTNGCFDILHPGHISLLTFCKKLTIDPLVVVGLNDDASIGRLKGPGRPVINMHGRRDQLEALRVVDHVVFFTEDTPEVLLKVVMPDFLVKGGDWIGKKVAGADFVLSNGGAVVFAPSLGNFSTTRILESPFRKAAELIEAGLRNGAAHHKQYFLEQALRVLYPKRKRGDWEPGKAP